MSESAVSERMSALPGGHYAMGSADFYPEEGPVHTVAVAPFEFDRGPVANRQFIRPTQLRRERNQSPCQF